MDSKRLLRLFCYVLNSEQDHAGDSDSAFELMAELWTSLVKARCHDQHVVSEIDALIADSGSHQHVELLAREVELVVEANRRQRDILVPLEVALAGHLLGQLSCRGQVGFSGIDRGS